MSNDIERLLTAAADDTDQPLNTDIDAILARGRRSVRRGRLAAGATATLTAVAVIGGFTVWSNTLDQGEGPAGAPKSETITVNTKTGQVVDNESGTTATAPPPVSPLSDAEVLKRCVKASPMSFKRTVADKAGPVDARWKVILKSGDQNRLRALFLAPDKSIVFGCTMKDAKGPIEFGRYSTVLPGTPDPDNAPSGPQAATAAVMIPAEGVARVLVNIAGEKAPREALVAAGGFYTIGYPDWMTTDKSNYDAKLGRFIPPVQRIRAYDANGKRVYEWKYIKPAPPVQVPPDVKIKTADPIVPRTVLTKDPETGKPLAVVPTSPLSDEQVRTRCKKPDDAFFDGPGFGLPKPDPDVDQRINDAGRISPQWPVALKVGSDKRFTALLVSPGQNVVAWCYRAEKDAYDYTRHGVNADGTFGDPVKDEFSNWALVPQGVAQIIVDLPTGQVRAAISNGYYLWGTTGGSENFKKVRVRGYDADAKLVYDQRITVDAS
ncbi:hypothetical protein ACIA49_36920 [Kribbella sp. NPDC051587]|uniref:hypothetical protein n=1 Tax=Kribbella sp. NPDC051587 TaxID=3364119 RepID=UPI00378CE7FD